MVHHDRPVRIVQWTTGKVARESIKAILDRPDLELVGVYAFSKEKVGQDVGDLAKLGRKIGITATDDIAALLALRPDCVVYMPLHPDVEHMARLLRAGVNVVTTASFLTGRGYGEQARRTLEEAAQAGKASLFGSGINPGWIDNLAATASSACREVNLVRVTESFNIGLWAGDANQDVLGWGRPPGDPGHAADVEKATLPFGDAVEAIAEMFEFTLDDVRCEVDFAHATKDLDLPGRPVRKGHVAGIHAKWLGLAGGQAVVELNVQWIVSTDVEPAWEVAMAHLIEVNGTPQIKLRVDVLPADFSLPMEELIATGFVITAMPVVNAIPAVVAARPGIVTYAELPPVTSVLRPKP
jgi:2,4-diaminopentanoate dehydrogenase